MNSKNCYHDLDVYAVKLIRFKARQLSRLSFFGSKDIDDLEQELAIDLYRNMSRFDPKRASKHTFIDRVIENRAASLVAMVRAQSRYSGQSNISWEEILESGCADDVMSSETSSFFSESNDIFDIEVALDFENCLQRMSKELQCLCFLLPFHRPSVISLEMGWSRATFFRRVACLRETFRRAGLENFFVPA